jgi:Flp pilus assembly protein TadG
MRRLPAKSGGSTVTRRDDRRRERSRGQALVIFAASILMFIGLMAIVIDVTWYWVNSLKVQRAADAAALAGAVWLPDQPAKAVTVALASAKQNGYTTGGGVTVTAAQNSLRDIQLDTSVSAPVTTFFMRLFGINTLQATRNAAAEYVLPVPMGSPLNYFGAFGALRGGWIRTDTSWLYPTHYPAQVWAAPDNAFTDEAPNPPLYASTGNTTDAQAFTTFRLPGYSSITNFGMSGTSTTQFQANGGIEVVVKAYSNMSGCTLRAELSTTANQPTPTWFGSTSATGDPATLTTTATEYTFGGSNATSSSDSSDWWRTTGWTYSDFSDAHFAVRLKATGTGGCATATTYVDYLKVRVSYEEMEPLIKGPHSEPLTQQGAWAGILSQGADVINGDAFAPKYSSGASGNLNSQYAPTAYYDYAVEFQPLTSNGTVYVFDPVFCSTASDFSQGMGDTWYGSSNPVSTWFDLYDTNNTPYDLSDDVWIAGNSPNSLPPSQGGGPNPNYNLFRRSNGTDTSQGGPSVSGGRTDCQRGNANTDPTKGAYWHDRWWPLASGVPGPTDTTPRVYRIRVTSTDFAYPNDQNGTAALNNFSIFAAVAGHTCPTTPYDPKCPRVYGYGSMVAFTPLDSGGTADLYLSQIGKVYAGKIIKISLWDPGDTNNLSANLSFLMPTTGGYTASGFTWSATRFSPNGSNCNGSSPGTVTAVTTNTGSGGSKFNGCWLVIQILIPTNYAAPTPPGEVGPGWWKIRYQMGSQGGTASDLTTWKTQIIGNPVHLVVP